MKTIIYKLSLHRQYLYCILSSMINSMTSGRLQNSICDIFTTLRTWSFLQHQLKSLGSSSCQSRINSRRYVFFYKSIEIHYKWHTVTCMIQSYNVTHPDFSVLYIVHKVCVFNLCLMVSLTVLHPRLNHEWFQQILTSLVSSQLSMWVLHITIQCSL